MKQSTVSKRESELKEKVKSVFKMAEIKFLTCRELNQTIKKEIFDDPNFSKIPRYSRTYIQGYLDCCRDFYWNKVKWVFPYDGYIYNFFSDLPKEGKKVYKKISGLHVYIDNPQKRFTGTDNHFKLGVKEK